MKKITILLLTLIFAPMLLLGQERIPVELDKTRVYLNIITPGITLEQGLSERLSLTLGAGLSPLYQDEKASINPFFRTSFRNYYPRKKVKKELGTNSGNFIGLVGGYYFSPISGTGDTDYFRQANSMYFGALWGIQRNYKSGIHLGFSIGSGFGTGDNMDLDFVGVGEFELGFTLK